jgi:hypothetical protein
MGGDYPSSEFEISEEGDLRRVVHLPTGIVVETRRSPHDPISVSIRYTVEGAASVSRPQEIVQAALRHLRVWLMRRYDRGWRVSLKER